jgi:hypothetical protein
MADDAGFLSRWSRRKAQAQAAAAPPEPNPALPLASEMPLVPTPAESKPTPDGGPDDASAVPAPTLDDVALLTRESDFSRFVARDVAGDVKNAALKKLFSDPHFNVMDGLDTYIDDYGKPDPLPAGWLRKMTQSHLLGLFAETQQQPTPASADPAAPPSPPVLPADENTDLRLQPDDAAGPTSAEPGADPDPGRQR